VDISRPSKRAGEPRAERSESNAFSWTVVAVIGVYSVALGLGTFLYRSIFEAPAGHNAMPIAKNERFGRIFVVTPHGCQSAKFDNSRPAEFKLSRRSCDDMPNTLGSDRRRQPDALTAIHQYFRGAD